MRCRALAGVAVGVAVSLCSASGATAATCNATSDGDWGAAGTWDCGAVPGPADTAAIPGGRTVTVSANESVGTLDLDLGTLSFAGLTPPTLGIGTLTAKGGVIRNRGSAVVSGSFTKVASGVLAVQDAASLVLNGPGTFSRDEICLGRGLTSTDGTMTINGAFVIASTAAADTFDCTSAVGGGADLVIGPSGTLSGGASPTQTIASAVQNNGVLTASGGELDLTGGDGGLVSSGTYSSAAGATLGLTGTSNPYDLGATGAISGAGTVLTNGVVELASGAALDPHALTQTGGSLTLDGTNPAAQPASYELQAGMLAGTRPFRPSAFDAKSGTLRGAFTTTIASGASFSKTTGGILAVQDGADLVLDVPTVLGGGEICIGRNTTATDGTLTANAAFTIAQAADAAPFGCQSAPGSSDVVVGADGSLSVAGTSPKAIESSVANAGALAVGAGQEIDLDGPLTQTGGTTSVAAGGTLAGTGPRAISGGTVTLLGTMTGVTTLTGGALQGTGHAGTVVNSGGVVRPGASPGTLTVDGDYTQGASGTLDVDVAGTTPGTQFDVLAVGHAAHLAGTLAIARDAAFQPQDDDAFTFLTAGDGVDGAFGTVTGAALGGGRVLTAFYAPKSATLSVVLPAAPVAGRPAVTGTPAVAQILTCDEGSWTGSPAFGYAWLRDGSPIAGATARDYAVVPGDAGHALACRVTGTNAGGSATATSAPVDVAAPQVPPAAATPVTSSTPAPAPAPSAPAPARSVEQTLAAETPAEVAAALRLPTARRCLSRRAFAVHLTAPSGLRVARVAMAVAGRKVPIHGTGRSFTGTVDLRGLPKGRFTLKITLTTNSGVRIVGSRAYRTCLPKRG